MKKGHLIRAILIPLFVGIYSVESLSQTDTRLNRESTPLPVSSHPPVEMRLREMRFGKPPLVELYFDVVLRNSRAESRWFLLPRSLGLENATTGGVDGIEVFAPHGKGRIVIGRFLGTGGFQALLLAPRAQVRIRRFPISFWGDPPHYLRTEVLTARRLTIGGEEAVAWFGVDPISSVRVDIVEQVDNPMRAVSSRHTPDNKEVAARMEEDDRIQLRVALNQKQ